jgi:hypothetical protein
MPSKSSAVAHRIATVRGDSLVQAPNLAKGGTVASTGEGPRWCSTAEAAAFLSMPVRVLRDALTEHARVVGVVVEARWEGIVGRRIGRRWKVWLGEAWTAPENSGRTVAVAGTVTSAESTRHGGKESPHGRA